MRSEEEKTRRKIRCWTEGFKDWLSFSGQVILICVGGWFLHIFIYVPGEFFSPVTRTLIRLFSWIKKFF